ncbi:hypothetical protein ABFV83_05390 [Lacrimispora sp. BS-2]|uniref:Uncharacterized protein n=1 Tax=Lacrimispora sp. BS-2 TaxID=3151850 RepID=A0AAU7PU10_9FIRM
MNGYGPVNTGFSFRATDNVLIFKKNIETGSHWYGDGADGRRQFDSSR